MLRAHLPDPPGQTARMLKSLFKQLFFVLRIAAAWGLAVMFVAALYSSQLRAW